MTRTSIGFDRALQLDWLDRVASLAAQGATTEEAREDLLTDLQEDFKGDEALAKAVLVMQRVWFPDQQPLVALRDNALAILSQVPGNERIAIHWSLVQTTYPFFFDCVETIGRLIRLQPTFTGVQVQSRIVDRWGDRAIVSRARQHVLQTLCFWNVLDMLSKRGKYAARDSILIRSIDVERLLAASLLAASSTGSVSMDDLMPSPALFAFSFDHSPAELFTDPSFSVWTEGSLRRSVALAD